jgi:DNA-binding beta-propeller fold protein YncE
MLAIAACDDGRGSTTRAASSPASLVALDGRPSAVALDEGAGVLWVADDEAGVVHRLSAERGEPAGPPVPVSPRPTAIDVEDGLVWVADPDGTLTRLDASTGTAAGPPIAVGGVLVDVVADGDRVWVADIEGSLLHTVDVATGAVGDGIPVRAGVVRMAVAGPRLWVTGLEAEVTPVDRATGTVGDPVPVGNGPIGLAADAREGLWVANSDDATVSRLAADDGQALGPAISVGPAPIDVAVLGDDVWVLDQDGPSLTHLDAETGRTIDRVQLPLRPRGLVATAETVWVVGVDPGGAARLAVLMPARSERRVTRRTAARGLATGASAGSRRRGP